MRLAIMVAVITLLLTGCAPVDMDQIMGRTDGTAVVEPQKLDCDLIFPPVTVDP